jgi:hypothetical protein
MRLHHFIFKIETMLTAGVIILVGAFTIWLIAKSMKKND